MYKNFGDIISAAIERKPKRTIAIAAAAEDKLLELSRKVTDMGLCNVILVGAKAEIKELSARTGISLDGICVENETEPAGCALRAVELVSSGKADVLVKGKLNTSDFLRAVLDKEVGLRTGRQLNVLMCYEVPGQKKLFFITDGGMNIAPTLEDKLEILRNAVPVLHNMGIETPKVALLAANERVNPKMPATTDADAIVKIAGEGKLPQAIYEGPIAFDVAMRPDAAEEKNIASRISGDVDLFLVPNIEAGNFLGKSIGYFGKGQTAGMVIGAAKPVVMTSRSAPVGWKLASVAWAILACR